MSSRALFFVTGVCCLISAASAAEPIDSPSEVAEPNVSFEGKIVLLEFDESSALQSKTDSVVLEHARLVRIGGRYFIVGITYAKHSPYAAWYNDVFTGVPWSRVLKFQAMKPEDYKMYTEKWKEHADELKDKG